MAVLLGEEGRLRFQFGGLGSRFPGFGISEFNCLWFMGWVRFRAFGFRCSRFQGSDIGV